jgi:hypothetical protein
LRTDGRGLVTEGQVSLYARWRTRAFSCEVLEHQYWGRNQVFAASDRSLLFPICEAEHDVMLEFAVENDNIHVK